MRIRSFQPTCFISKDSMVRCMLWVEDWDHCNPYFLSASLNGKRVIERQASWSETMTFELPLVEEPSELRLDLYPFEDICFSRNYSYHPPKKLQIDFFLSSHEDLGYCAYANKLGAECADYLNAALNLAQNDSRFSYMVEHYWWMRAFEDYCNDGQREQLLRLLAKGQIEQTASHCSNHTHWQGGEQLVRAMYYACREGAKNWNITPRTVVYADIAGASWSCVSAYAGAGIRYMLILSNRYLRFSTDDEELPPVFWWEAPNGRDRLLCFMQKGYKKHSISRAMGQASSQTKDSSSYYFDATRMEATIQAIDDMACEFGDIPYDRLPVSFYMDREYPNKDIQVMCDAMSEHWEYPKMRISTPEKTFEYIEKRFGGQLPVLRGDISDQWADFAAISPVWFADKRYAQKMLPIAETLSLIKSLRHDDPLPVERLKEAMWKLCEFDDHCWATSSKHPQEMHKFNLNLVKRETAKTAKRLVDQVLTEAIGCPGSKRLSVWNPLPFERSTSIRLPADQIPSNLLCQKMSDGSVLTAPVLLPAFGCRPLELGGSTAAAPAYLEASTFETTYYAVSLDHDAQRIISIIDKQTDRQLLDAQSEYSLGECIYVNAEHKHSLPVAREFAKRRGMSVNIGPLAVEVTLLAFEEQINANIRTVFTFYQNDRSIDVFASFENATGLMGDFYDRYKKNLFFAFPFLMDDHHFCTSLASGMVDERGERLPINPHDFVMADSWVSVENGEHGIGIMCRELPLFHLGAIHYNEISARTDHGKSASIFLYAASNRANNLNYCEPSDCRGSFHLSFLPFTGEGRCALPAWAYAQRQPPLLGAWRENESLLSVSEKNLHLLCLKPSEDFEDRVFVRLYEAEGRHVKARLRLPFEVSKAEWTDNLEQPSGGTAQCVGHEVLFESGPYSYVNLLLTPAGAVKLVPEPPQEGVKNVFTFTSENRSTVVCFEKAGKRPQAYRIMDGDTELARIDDEPYKVQQCLVPGIYDKSLRVEQLFIKTKG